MSRPGTARGVGARPGASCPGSRGARAGSAPSRGRGASTAGRGGAGAAPSVRGVARGAARGGVSRGGAARGGVAPCGEARGGVSRGRAARGGVAPCGEARGGVSRGRAARGGVAPCSEARGGVSRGAAARGGVSRGGAARGGAVRGGAGRGARGGRGRGGAAPKTGALNVETARFLAAPTAKAQDTGLLVPPGAAATPGNFVPPKGSARDREVAAEAAAAADACTAAAEALAEQDRQSGLAGAALARGGVGFDVDLILRSVEMYEERDEPSSIYEDRNVDNILAIQKKLQDFLEKYGLNEKRKMDIRINHLQDYRRSNVNKAFEPDVGAQLLVTEKGLRPVGVQRLLEQHEIDRAARDVVRALQRQEDSEADEVSFALSDMQQFRREFVHKAIVPDDAARVSLAAARREGVSGEGGAAGGASPSLTDYALDPFSRRLAARTRMNYIPPLPVIDLDEVTPPEAMLEVSVISPERTLTSEAPSLWSDPRPPLASSPRRAAPAGPCPGGAPAPRSPAPAPAPAAECPGGVPAPRRPAPAPAPAAAGTCTGGAIPKRRPARTAARVCPGGSRQQPQRQLLDLTPPPDLPVPMLAPTICPGASEAERVPLGMLVTYGDVPTGNLLEFD